MLYMLVIVLFSETLSKMCCSRYESEENMRTWINKCTCEGECVLQQEHSSLGPETDSVGCLAPPSPCVFAVLND